MSEFSKILLWTYGKTGSTSILSSFPNYIGNKNTLQLVHSKSHNLDNYQVYQIHGIECGEYFLNHYKNMLIITTVRNPLERNISAFWQNIDTNCPQWKQMSTEDIITIFNNTYNHNLTDEWIKGFFEKTGIDFTEFSFDPFQKYVKKIVKNNNLMILSRFEDMDFVIDNVYNKYVKISKLKKNAGENKKYSSKYKDFKEKYRLPKNLLEIYKNQETLQKFYSEAELNTFFNKYK